MKTFSHKTHMVIIAVLLATVAVQFARLVKIESDNAAQRGLVAEQAGYISYVRGLH